MEEVKVYVDCLDGANRGDLVRCSDCGELMLIQIGEQLAENVKVKIYNGMMIIDLNGLFQNLKKLDSL